MKPGKERRENNGGRKMERRNGERKIKGKKWWEKEGIKLEE